MWFYYRVICPKDADNSVERPQLGEVQSGSTLLAQTCLSEN